MKSNTSKRVKLGAFVLGSTLLLILGLYYIGSQRNIFHSTISLQAEFKNVQGLMPGNNVQFNGINVGSVSQVELVADTLIRVTFTVDEGTAPYIDIKALASIVTDGLLGNKMLSISPNGKFESAVKDGDFLQSAQSIEMATAMRTLNLSSENLLSISENLKSLTARVNSNTVLWRLLEDESIASHLRSAVVGIQLTSENTAVLSGDLREITQGLKSGKSMVGALLTDTVLSNHVKQTIIQWHAISDSVALITGDFHLLSKELQNKNGSVAALLMDTTFVPDLNASMQSIRSSTQNIDELSKALKFVWPFRRYFKKAK